MAPTVSVVITAYNAGRHVKDALDSIVNQSFSDFELIFVDDASTDTTADIIAQYAAKDDRILPLQNEVNLGISRSFNKGLSYAQGKYLARMDSDDISHPDRLKLQSEVLVKDDSISLVGSDYMMIDDSNRELALCQMPRSNDDIKARQWMYPCFAGGGIMMRTDTLKRLGGFRTELSYSADYDICLRLSEVANVSNIPEPLLKYRVHMSSVSGAHRPEQAELGLLVVLLAAERKVRGEDSLSKLDFSSLESLARTTSGYPVPGDMNQRDAARLHAEWSSILLKRKRLKPAVRNALRALRLSPSLETAFSLAGGAASVASYAFSRTTGIGLNDWEKSGARAAKAALSVYMQHNDDEQPQKTKQAAR